MKLPRKFRAYGLDWAIRANDSIDEGGLFGRTNQREKLVEIATIHGREGQVMLHELVHVVDFEQNSGNLDENVIRTLAAGLYMILKDNPKVAQFILEN